MQKEEHLLVSAATGRVGMGTHDTTLIGRVEPSSFGAVGDRLLVHLTSSKNTACLGDTPTATQSSNVLVEEPTLEFRNLSIWRRYFRSEVSSCASRPIETMVRINEVDPPCLLPI